MVAFLLIVGIAYAADPVALKVQGPDTSAGNPLFVQSQAPGGPGTTQTPVTSSSTGANTAITATLPGVAGKTTYITGLVVSGNGATASSGITVTVTGTVSGTLNIVYVTGALNTAGDGFEQIAFTPPVPASATNTAIVVNVPAMGAGNTLAAVSAWGFQQ